MTISDLVAIFRHTGLRPSEVAALFSADVAGDWQTPKVKLRNGQYYIVLRKRIDGSCIFNEWRGDKLICSIHEFKPLTCRFYPFIYFWGNGVLHFELYSKAVGYCPGVGNGPFVNLVKESTYAVESRRAKEELKLLIDHWNRLVNDKTVAGTVDVFMRFLDCIVESLANGRSDCVAEFKLGDVLLALSSG